MIVRIDREKKIVLLRWLKQGYINTLDLPEVYKNGNLFLDLMIEAGDNEQDEGQQEGGV